MKRLLSVLLVILLTVGLLPVIPVAAEDANLELYTYEVADGEATITKVDAAISGDITIPSQLDGCPVTTIGAEAFSFCTLLTKVVIPNSVTKIDEAAFYGCSSLTAVDIPGSVTSIGKGAFYNCVSLTFARIPDSVTQVGDYLFAWCSALSDVVLSNSLTQISEFAFYGCSNLVNVVIPNSVTSIAKAAFYECSSLTNVVMGDNVASIGDYAFAKCGSLSNVRIPAGVTEIGEYAFSWCVSLTEIIIPDSVITVGKFGFGGCSGLRNLTIGDSVAVINEGTFFACSSLLEAIIGKNVTIINNHAFVDCSSLTKVTLPVSITGIGVQAFDGCTSLRTVRYCADEVAWQSVIIAAYNECLLNANIVFDFVPIVNGRVEYWRLVLQDNIGVSFQMEYTDSVKADPNAYVEITVAGEMTTIPVSAAMESIYVSVAAAQMTDEITVCVVSGNGSRGETGTYSVKAYADQILNGKYDKATRNLVKALLSYGATAQDFFDYREDSLANTNVDFSLIQVPAAEETQMSIFEELDGISFYGASLLYNSALILRFYFEADDISQFVFTANGKQLQPVEKSGQFYVQIPDILPQNISKAVHLLVQDAQGNSVNIFYTPLDYVIRMYHKADTTEETRKLLQALYTYHLTAKAYAA